MESIYLLLYCHISESAVHSAIKKLVTTSVLSTNHFSHSDHAAAKFVPSQGSEVVLSASHGRFRWRDFWRECLGGFHSEIHEILLVTGCDFTWGILVEIHGSTGGFSSVYGKFDEAGNDFHGSVWDFMRFERDMTTGLLPTLQVHGRWKCSSKSAVSNASPNRLEAYSRIWILCSMLFCR